VAVDSPEVQVDELARTDLPSTQRLDYRVRRRKGIQTGCRGHRDLLLALQVAVNQGHRCIRSELPPLLLNLVLLPLQHLPLLPRRDNPPRHVSTELDRKIWQRAQNQ